MTDIQQPLIFISHTTRDPRDSQRAHRLAAGLRRCGARTWIAPDDIPKGAAWEEQLVAAIIHQATHFLVILSAASTRAKWVLKELDLASERQQRDQTLTILPLVVGEVGGYKGSKLVERLQRIPYHESYTEQLRAVAAAVGLRADVGSPLPLTMPSAESESETGFDLSWLGYRKRQARLVGREAEKTALQDFYDSPEPMKWWAIDGPGGVGKSRLALDSVHALPDNWVRGFLDATRLDARDLAQWVPDADTVIVVDDAAAAVAAVDALLRHMESRTSELTHKVRILLIERITESQKWWAEICRQGRDDQGRRMASFHHGTPLSVERLDANLQPAALRAFLDSGENGAAVTLPDAGSPFWSKVDSLSDHGRPLFLGLLAAAVAELGPEHLRSWNTGALVEFVYNREMSTWERLYPDESLRRRVRDIVAIATACRGFDFERHEKQITECLTSLNLVIDLDDAIWEAVVAVTGSLNSVVEPDVLGEYFLTRAWEKPAGRPVQPVVNKVLAAFDLRPAAVAYTIRNAVSDFPDCETPLWWMETLAKDRFTRDHRLRIMDLFVRAVRSYGDAAEFEFMQRCVCRIREWTRGLAAFGQEHNNLSEAATTAAVACARAKRWSHVEELVGTVRELAAAFPTHANLQSNLVRNANTIIAASAEAGRPETLERAIGALEDVEARHPHLNADRLASAVCGAESQLMDSDQSDGISRCMRMMQRLATLYGGVDAPPVQLMLAATAFAAVRHNLRMRNWGATCWAYVVLAKANRERESEDRIAALFDSASQQLFADEEARNRTEPLRQTGTITQALGNKAAPPSATETEALVAQLRSLVDTHADNGVVSISFAGGLADAIAIYAAAGDVERVDAALDELRILGRQFPESLEIRDLVASGLDRAVAARPGDLDRTNNLLEELRTMDGEVRKRFWHESDVTHKLARALARAVQHHLQSGHPQLIPGRLDELEGLVHHRFPWRDEIVFLLAEALRDAMVFYVQANDPEQVRSLVSRLVKLKEYSHEEIVSTVDEAARLATVAYRNAGLQSEASELERVLEEADRTPTLPVTTGPAMKLMALYRDGFAPGGIESRFEMNV